MATNPPAPIKSTASSTLHLLESRLHRLTYLLTGDAAWTGTPTPPSKPASHDETVSSRLLRLEDELGRLSAKSAAVRDVLGLYDRFPDLFNQSHSHSQQQQQQSDPSDPSSPTPDADQPTTTTTTTTTTAGSSSGPSSDLPLQTLQSITLSYASTIPETASRLTSLNDTPIPDPSLSASLIELTPRMDKLARLQDEHAREVAVLRVRTAKALQRFYEVAVLGGGEVWGEWEGRIEGVERGVRRGEVERGREGL